MRYSRESYKIFEAGLSLSKIKNDPEDLSAVLELQRLLIRHIIKAERRIIRLKRARARIKSQIKNGRHAKQRSKSLKNLIDSVDVRLVDIYHLLFVWRCFGDGIANIYQSKYSLKHLYYNENYEVKENAGFISGKAGFKKEYQIFRLGIRMGVPVVMSDLTNIIRHGDVCALAGEDPVPIEVKSSNLNKRGERQVKQLTAIANFYSNDGATNFRGMPLVKRVELRTPEINFEAEINQCIAEAAEKGCSSITPETGLTYFVFRKNYSSQQVINFFEEKWGHVGKHTMLVQLTCDENWLPSYPFTLSLSAPNSFLFIQELICIYIFIDCQTLKNHFLLHGVHATILMDTLSSIQVCLDPDDLMKGVFRITEQKFLRGICEFQSLIWFAEENSALLKCPPRLDGVDEDAPLIYDPPEEWKHVKDFYIT